VKTNGSPRSTASRPTEKTSTSSRSTTTTWYDTRFPSISINSTPTFNRSHSIKPSCDRTVVQRRTRCTRTSAGSSATLWTEESHPYLVLGSSPRPPPLASIEVNTLHESGNHVPLCTKSRKYSPRETGYLMNSNWPRFIGQTAVLFSTATTYQNDIESTSQIEPNRQAYLFPFAWFPLERNPLLQRFYKQRVFYWCLPWEDCVGSLGV
jgi:hypothetical protein